MVSSGVLQNTYVGSTNDENEPQVPRPSLFVLYAHVVTLLKSASVSNWNFVAATCVRNMIEFVAVPIDGATFEKFHAHWHALVMLLCARRGDMEALSLSSTENTHALYRNAIVSHGEDITLDRLVPTPKNAVVQVSGRLSDASRTVWHDKVSGLDEVPLTTNQVVLPGEASNIGFDALVMHRTTSGEPHLVLIECKNSAVNAKTQLRYAVFVNV